MDQTIQSVAVLTDEGGVMIEFESIWFYNEWTPGSHQAVPGEGEAESVVELVMPDLEEASSNKEKDQTFATTIHFNTTKPGNILNFSLLSLSLQVSSQST